METITQRIQNYLKVEVDASVDFTRATDIEFYVKQGNLFFQYIPCVISETEFIVKIPKADALRISSNENIECQFAFTTENGIYKHSEIENISVDRFLKEAGYGD